MADRYRGAIYTGVTAQLVHRVYQHKDGTGSEFTGRYKLHRLVYFEEHADMPTAIAREKAIKKWRREWKIELIERENPDWLDLYERLV
ncbi:GIY-YIG nuclease family protein [Sphingomonas sp. AOB5]|uniref:GIY-YIG nuclease family protein n=1 Tax=Sphingomonas sp. AOB5 TaxID=3034017 RepID=UPI0023F85464|nr:GIY-YIG nuclease family protein [Sphingomonas sp. AOB5]MDF7777060.1 GIY-YIG nuclease family protein [Sphingomonas sp. AOB5]